MSNKYTNIRVLREDAETLKIVAALSRESMLQTFKRIVQQEHDRLHSQEKGENSLDAPLQKDQTSSF